MTPGQEETSVKCRVAYTLELDGKFFTVENVPARVDEEAGERFFSPLTVECLQGMLLGHAEPSKVIETPAYEYLE